MLTRTEQMQGFRKARAQVSSPQEVAEAIAAQYGAKARTVVHMLHGGKVVTVLPLDEAARLLAAQPHELLLLARRTDHGSIRAAFVRAGAIAWIEEA